MVEQSHPSEDKSGPNWLWIGGAAIATFLIASVLPTSILRGAGLLCIDAFQAVGAVGYSCLAPFDGSLEIGGGGLTLSLTTTAKVVLSLIAACVTSYVLHSRQWTQQQ